MLAAPLIAFLVRNVNQRFRRYSARIQSSVGDVTRVTKEALDGQRVVKVFNAQEHLNASFAEVNEQNRRTNMRLISASASSNPIVQLIAFTSPASYIAGRRVLRRDHRRRAAVPDAAAADSRSAQAPAPIARPLQRGIAAGANVFAELDTRQAGGHATAGARAARSSSRRELQLTRAWCCGGASGWPPARRSRSSAAPAAASRR
jgi:subfamily B ATP-binding cassette protein MsbA